MTEKKHHRVTTPLEGVPFKGWDRTRPIPAPLDFHKTPVMEAWVDYNDHMTESAFLLVFGDSSDAFFRFIGIDEAYRESGRTIFTIETRIHNFREGKLGNRLALTFRILAHDAKRLHVLHEMFNETTGDIMARGEQMLMHVDWKAGRSAPFPPELLERIEAITKAHAHLPVPETVGKPLGLKR
jgi:acyl-CoA thioester hydrolase